MPQGVEEVAPPRCVPFTAVSADVTAVVAAAVAAVVSAAVAAAFAVVWLRCRGLE
jgi:hypothetical protein